jgi:hypothetical protein
VEYPARQEALAPACREGPTCRRDCLLA